MSSPSVLVAFRTHTWNDVVEAVFGRLVAATRHRVIICADETNGACPTPASHQKVPHTCAMFNGMGLPSFPPERVLWYNGDYPLYHLADALDWDYLFIVEYDCAIVGSIDDVIGGLIREDLGYACPNYGPRSPRYRWHDQTMKWFSRHGRIETLYGGIWGCGLISRQAVVELRRARLEMAGIVKTAADWVMFEPFVANHLRLNGFSCAALSRFLHVEPADQASSGSGQGKPDCADHPSCAGITALRAEARRGLQRGCGRACEIQKAIPQPL